MTSLPRKIRLKNQELVDRASRGLPRNPDGSLVESDLRAAVATLVRQTLDPDAMANQKAAAVIESLTKQEGEDDGDNDSGQLRLQLGGESYGYNPQRLVKNSSGDIIEEELAPLSFLLAELRRSSENVQRAMTWNSRKARKAEHFQKWMEQALAIGRPNRELTWGNCARETGVIVGG